MSKIILGLDEAGRGPVIGPLIISGVAIRVEDEEKLKKIGVKDSKLLRQDIREEMYEKIKKLGKNKIIIVPAQEIDEALNGNELNLNSLEAKYYIEIINELNPDAAYIDCPSTNVYKFTEYVRERINNKKTELIVEHKADFTYPVVSAASILAKVTREWEIEKTKKKINKNFGSGYPSDPLTKEFLAKYYKEYKDIFRTTWESYKAIVRNAGQSTLFSFKEKEEKLSPKAEKKKKELLSLGLERAEAKGTSEVLRLKGDGITITLYTNGKILLQGKNKKNWEDRIS